MGDGSTATDADLIVASLQNPERFGALFDRHAVAVHRYAAYRARAGDVDDVVAETFVTAFRTRTRYDQAFQDARPWLLGIATNVLRQHRRSEGRRLARLRAAARASEPEPDPAETVAAAVDQAAQSDKVARALARLDERQQEVLVLAAGPGLTYEEIARALGIPVGTVRSRIARGRRHLRELLDAGERIDSETKTNNVTPATEGNLE
jgi:RNA polymerase sigma-70 factor, ECF subfamily